MKKSTRKLRVEASNIELTNTKHGLLAVAYTVVTQWGFIDMLGQVTVKMKKRDYSWADKMLALWASIVIGCQHTVEINDELGSHERELAVLFGFTTSRRFPDHSSISRALKAVRPEHVAQYRAQHQKMLHAKSHARARHRWLRLSASTRLLVVDIDQRGIVVHGKLFELAERGFFGRKRGRSGYELSLCYMGGEVGEVLDEFFDPGSTPAGHRVPEFLASIEALCQALGIAPSEVLVRADAAYGTAAPIKQIEAYGVHYLIRGLSTARARALLKRVADDAVFTRVKETSEREPQWMLDLGEIEHVDRSQKAVRGERLRARTLLSVSTRRAAQPGGRPGPSSREKRAKSGEGQRRETVVGMLLTNLSAEQLRLEQAIEVYDARTTIEHYFWDEAHALGARHVRSHEHAGAALFQWLVATTSNLLKWLQRRVLSRTPVAQFGIKQLVNRVFAIPALVRTQGRELVLVLPLAHQLVRGLATTWKLMRPKPPAVAPVQLQLPLNLEPISQGCLRKI